MKRALLVLAIGCATTAHVPPDGDAPPERDVLGQAMHVFASMRATAYTHETTIEASAGRFEFDCSGFVGYVLAQSRPRALAELRAATKQRPLAKHFVAFFQNLPAGSAWRRIDRAADLAPGDMIAWLRPDDVVSKNTGHVMIVRERPVQEAPDLWSVQIIDSTAVPHGKGDSRKARGLAGLGTGEVLLIVDEAGVPIGYRWSRGTRATLHLTTIALAGVRDQTRSAGGSFAR